MAEINQLSWVAAGFATVAMILNITNGSVIWAVLMGILMILNIFLATRPR